MLGLWPVLWIFPVHVYTFLRCHLNKLGILYMVLILQNSPILYYPFSTCYIRDEGAYSSADWCHMIHYITKSKLHLFFLS